MQQSPCSCKTSTNMRTYKVVSPSYKLISFHPINYRYITYKPYSYWTFTIQQHSLVSHEQPGFPSAEPVSPTVAVFTQHQDSGVPVLSKFPWASQTISENLGIQNSLDHWSMRILGSFARNSVTCFPLEPGPLARPFAAVLNEELRWTSGMERENFQLRKYIAIVYSISTLFIFPRI